MRTFNYQFESIEALNSWLDDLERQKPSKSILVQLFSGCLEPGRIERVAAEISDHFNGAVIIGATTSGEILDGKMYEETIVISISFFEKSTLSSTMIVNRDSYESGMELAERLVTDETRAMIVFGDSLHVNGDQLLKGLSQTSGDVVIAGGLAGDNGSFEKSYVIYNCQVLSNAVVGVALNGPDLEVFHDYNLSWLPVGKKMLVTKSDGTRVYEINNRPIREKYKKYLGAEVEQNLPESAVEFPLIFKKGELLVARAMLGAYDDGSIVFAGEIPEGEEVQFGIGNSTLLAKNAQSSLENAANHPIEGLFIYSCMARKKFLGKSLEDEFSLLCDAGTQSGFFTYGEFFHNQRGNELLNVTTTVLGLSESKEIHLPKERKLKPADRKTNSLLALMNLVNETTKELALEQNQRSATMDILEQYKRGIDELLIVSKTDLNGDITYANRHFCEVSGYSESELIGKNHRIVRAPDMDRSIYEDLWATILGKHNWQGVLKNVRKDGSAYYVKSTIIPLLDAKGEISEFIAFREDITQSIRQTRELKKQKELAESANRAKSEFLANMSHEIRTPMNGIIGFTSLLANSDMSKDQKRQLAIIESSGNMLLSIVNDILDYSKIESGKLTIESIDANPFIEFDHMAKIFEAAASQKNISYKIHIDPTISESIRMDIFRVKQVLLNLIGNAIKFTPDGGRVDVNIKKIFSEGARETLLFEVLDSGIGIPLAHQKEIFEAFSQADSSVTRRFGGTGLGLSISASLVEMMGGQLHVESEEGKGSRVYFELTVASNRKVRELSSMMDDTYICIVKDNEARHKLVIEQLEQLSLPYRVCERLSGEIDAYEQHCSVVITFDCEKIKEIKQLPEISYQVILFDLSDEGCIEAQRGDITVVKLDSDDAIQLYNTLLELNINARVHDARLHAHPQLALKVLVAEDYEINQILMSELLQGYGIEPDFANDGEEALLMAQKNRYDLIFMDINMPKMNGMDTARAIRETLKSEVQIIALTANALEGDAQRYLSCGMNDYLSKPIDRVKLNALLMPFQKSAGSKGYREADEEDEIKKSLDYLQIQMNFTYAVTQKLLRSFFDTSLETASSLVQASEEKDYAEIAIHAHNIKGAAVTFAFEKIVNLAKLIERNAQNKSLIDYEGYSMKLQSELIALKEKYRNFKD